MQTVRTAIKHYRERLTRKAKKGGIWENFGQEEVSILRDTFLDHQYKNDGVWDGIRAFDHWCQTFTV